jgi:hypothetical protein
LLLFVFTLFALGDMEFIAVLCFFVDCAENFNVNGKLQSVEAEIDVKVCFIFSLAARIS